MSRQNTNIGTLDAALFAVKPPLHFLDISHNPITTVPEAVFTSPTSLGVIRMYGTDLECSCASLWFMGHVLENYLTLEGDIVCTNTGTSS